MKTSTRALLALLALLVAFAAGCGTAAEDMGADTATDTESTDTSADGGQDAGGDEGDAAEAAFAVTSSAFQDGGAIPVKYARQGVEGGQNVSPGLSWADVPADANSFALVIVDRHPLANEWIHWMVVDIDPTATGLGEGASGSSMPAGARELQNTWGEAGYGGPQPPPDSGDHEYEVTVYALDVRSVDLPDDADFAQFLTEMRDHMLAAATVSGTFGR